MRAHVLQVSRPRSALEIPAAGRLGYCGEAERRTAARRWRRRRPAMRVLPLYGAGAERRCWCGTSARSFCELRSHVGHPAAAVTTRSATKPTVDAASADAAFTTPSTIPTTNTCATSVRTLRGCLSVHLHERTRPHQMEFSGALRGQRVVPISAQNPGGQAGSPFETPASAIDGSTQTKWSDTNFGAGSSVCCRDSELSFIARRNPLNMLYELFTAQLPSSGRLTMSQLNSDPTGW
eukprot:6624834-Prymnesium_polylepis.3